MATKAEIEQTEIEASYELPDGWKWCRLGEVVEVLNGYAFKSENYVHQGIRVIRITNVQDGYIEDLKPCFYPKEYSNDLSQYTLYENDLLISLTGNVGRVALLPKNFLPAALNQRVGCLREKNNQISKKYIAYYLRQHKFLSDCIKSSKGTAQLNMSTEWLKRYPIPLPPTLTEQQRIVNRTETMFAKLDQAQEKAQSVLDSFETRKAAILHKAFTGELTANWRKENGVSDESWEEKKIGECCKLGSGGTPLKSHTEYYENGDIPWLKTGEIDWNDIYDVEEKITTAGVANSSAKIYPAESVVVAMYGMGVTRGKAGILKIPTTTNQAVCVLQPNKSLFNRYLFYYFMCNYWTFREKAVGGNQLNYSATMISKWDIAIPSLPEQQEIVRILNTVLEKESRAKEAAQTVLDQIALLKKSILARAFRGEL